MPSKVRGFCFFGKRRDIEMEESPEPEYVVLMTNWLEAIKNNTPLLARGDRGISKLLLLYFYIKNKEIIITFT